MSDAISVGKNVGSLNVSPLFNSYAGVFIHTSDEDEEVGYGAGDITGATGRVLEFYNPWAVQGTADDVLSILNGWQYQPFEATDALADPAAELGDGVTINGMYSGIFTQELTFSPLMASRITAPQDEEITHEYGYATPEDRQYQRKMSSISATLLLNAEQIDARVTKTSPEGQTSFGWNLTDSEWTIYNGNKTILRASASGLAVYGQIEAESGHIGGNNGFVITANAIYKNLSTFGGTQSSGVYIGTDGIQLGQGFKVDSSGRLTASSGTFTGAVYAGSIKSDGANGYGGSFHGSGISGGSISTVQTSGGINASLGYADFANGVFNGTQSARTGTFGSLNITGSFAYGTKSISQKQMTVKNSLGQNVTIYYLGYNP